jgi:hypothetical protein
LEKGVFATGRQYRKHGRESMTRARDERQGRAYRQIFALVRTQPETRGQAT